jgi:hypothetical protein
MIPLISPTADGRISQLRGFSLFPPSQSTDNRWPLNNRLYTPNMSKQYYDEETTKLIGANNHVLLSSPQSFITIAQGVFVLSQTLLTFFEYYSTIFTLEPKGSIQENHELMHWFLADDKEYEYMQQQYAHFLYSWGETHLHKNTIYPPTGSNIQWMSNVLRNWTPQTTQGKMTARTIYMLITEPLQRVRKESYLSDLTGAAELSQQNRWVKRYV